MINCNPETVSTDYDTSDRLYFEPLTAEDVGNVLDAEARAGGRIKGVVVALGGQTPLKLAGSLPTELVLGTSPASIDRAEDREQWNALCETLGIPQPPGGTAVTTEEALAIARRVGYPALVRPSYVLGGRAMEIVYDDADVRRVMAALAGTAGLAREGGVTAERPVLVDRFLEDAVEVDVDAIRDRAGETLICGIMEHVEEAGVHSGDSACALPPQTLAAEVLEQLDRHTRNLADALGGRRTAERPVRGEGRGGLRPRGEPTGEPDGPVRRQGHRRGGGDGRGAWSWSATRWPSCAARSSYRRTRSARSGRSTMSASRRPSCRSTGSPVSTRCSGRRCGRPAR